MSRFPPGPYEVTLRASSGSISPISVDLSFKVMLIDPCPTAVIARPDQSSADFSDSVYTLGQEAIVQEFDLVSLAAVSGTYVDCGNMMIEFVEANEQIINDKIFTVAQEGTTGSLSIDQQVDQTTAGEYEIRYRIYLEQYPSVPALIGLPFTVVIQKLVVTEKLAVSSDYTFDLAPDWFHNLQDKYVVIGNNLIYPFGKTQTWTGQEISVQVDLGEIESFARYDPERNQIIVIGLNMTAETDIGIHQIEVQVSYNNPTSQVQSERKVFYLHVLAKTQLKIKEVKGEEEIVDLVSFEGDFDGSIMTKPQEKNIERPIPYIADFSPTGILQIAWDRKMKPFEDPDQIPPAKVAVQSYIMEQIKNSHRKVQAYLNNLNLQQFMVAQSVQVRYLLLSALEVKLRKDKDKDSDELEYVQTFDWDVISQDDEMIRLQVNFEDPDDISFSSCDFIVITFYGVEFFQSYEGIDVEFGMQVAWAIQRQMSKTSQTETECIYSFSFLLVSVTILVVLCLIGIGGGTLPTWMFINTMSLIVHTPLLIADMPANLRNFLQKYLDIMRLDLNFIKERAIGIDNLRGYSFDYWNNTVLISSIGLSLLTTTAVFYLCCKKGKVSSNRAAWMANFTLRYAYVVFFEVFLCLIIQVTADSYGQGGWWLSLILLVVLCLGVGLLLVLMCMAGRKTQQPVSAQTTSQNEHHDEENTARDGTSSNLIPLNKQQAVEEYEGGQQQLSAGRQEEIKNEAHLNVTNTIKVNQAYKTLFLGLKKNQCQHVLTFIARRVLFVVAVVFMTQYSFLGILQLMITCLIMSALAQWQDSLITLQHLVNEAFFYFLLCCGLVPGGLKSSQVGHMLVLSTTALISFNMIIIIFDLARHLRLLFRRYCWRYLHVKQPIPVQKKPKSIKKQSSRVQQSQRLHQTIELDPEMELGQAMFIDELDQIKFQDQNVGSQDKARPESTGSQLSQAMMDVPDQMIDISEENLKQLYGEQQSNQQRSEIVEIDKFQTPQNGRNVAQESVAINFTSPLTSSAGRNLLTLQQSCGRPPTLNNDSLSQNEELSPFRPRRYMEDNQDEKRRTQIFPRLMTAASYRNEHLTAVDRHSNMNFSTLRSQPRNEINSEVSTQKALLPGAVAKEYNSCLEGERSIDSLKEDSKCHYKDDSSHQQRNSSSQSKLELRRPPHELMIKTVRVASDKFDCAQEAQVCQGTDDEEGQALALQDKMAVSEGKRVQERPDQLPDQTSCAKMPDIEALTATNEKAEFNSEERLAQNEQDIYKTVKETLAEVLNDPDLNDSDQLEKDCFAKVCDDQPVGICEAKDAQIQATLNDTIVFESAVEQAGTQDDGQVTDVPVSTDDENVAENAIVQDKEDSELFAQKSTGEEKVSCFPLQQATSLDGSVQDELTKHAQFCNQPIKEAIAEGDKASDFPIFQAAAAEVENIVDQRDQKAEAKYDHVSHQHASHLTTDDEHMSELTLVKVLNSDKQDPEFPVIQAAAEDDEKVSDVHSTESTPQDGSISCLPFNQAATEFSQASNLPLCESFEENKDTNDFLQIQVDQNICAQPDKQAVTKGSRVSDSPNTNKDNTAENEQVMSMNSLEALTEDKQAQEFPAVIQAAEGYNLISNKFDKKNLLAEDDLISQLTINKTTAKDDKESDNKFAYLHRKDRNLPGKKVKDSLDKDDPPEIDSAEKFAYLHRKDRNLPDKKVKDSLDKDADPPEIDHAEKFAYLRRKDKIIPDKIVKDSPEKEADPPELDYAEMMRRALAKERALTSFVQINIDKMRAKQQSQKIKSLPTFKAAVSKLDLQFYPDQKASNRMLSMGQKQTYEKIVGMLRSSSEQQRLIGDSIPKIEANEDQVRLQRQFSGSSIPGFTSQRSIRSFSDQKQYKKVPERSMQVKNLPQVSPIRKFNSFGDENGDDQQQIPSKLSSSRLPKRSFSTVSKLNEGSLGSIETPLEQIDEDSDYFKPTAAANYQPPFKKQNTPQNSKTKRVNQTEAKSYKRSKTYHNLEMKRNSTSMDLAPVQEFPELINQRVASKQVDDDMRRQNHFVDKTSQQSESKLRSGPIAPPQRRIEFFKGRASTSFSINDDIGSINNESRYNHEYGKQDDNTRRSGSLIKQKNGKLVLQKRFSLPPMQTPDP